MAPRKSGGTAAPNKLDPLNRLLLDTNFPNRRTSARLSSHATPVPTDSASTSSAATPLATTVSSTSSIYTTPGTSIPPSVDGENGSGAKVPALSEYDTRHSIYALNPKRKRTVIADSEDEDEDEDDYLGHGPDAQLTRRLQEEEYDGLELVLPLATPTPVRQSPRQSIKPTPSSPAIATPAPAAKPRRGRPPAKMARTGNSFAGSATTRTAAAATAPVVAPETPTPKRGRGRPRKTPVKPVEAAAPTKAEYLSHAEACRPLYGDSDSDSDSDSELDSESESDLEYARRLDEDDLDLIGISENTIQANPGIDDFVSWPITPPSRRRRGEPKLTRAQIERQRLEKHHAEILTMWDDLEAMAVVDAGRAQQPAHISRRLKPFQLEGLAWMKAMEKTKWKGGLLGDEMGLGKTIQAVSLIMSDFPVGKPSLVLVPPVALMQWKSEIESYTDGTLKTFVYHGTNAKSKNMTARELKGYDVVMMSYNSLESMYRKQEKGFSRTGHIIKERSVIHQTKFHRVILDEAHSIKSRTTMTAKACFALKADYRWCLTGTPLQNRIGEFFSLVRFLNIRPFSSYLCKACPCTTLEWQATPDSMCSACKHPLMQHVSVFNQELLNPIQSFGNYGPGAEAFRKLHLLVSRIMLRRLKKDNADAMEIPTKEVHVDRQFFSAEEADFAASIMSNSERQFNTYIAQGVLLNNYANIFGLIMQMRQVADHPDLIVRKEADGSGNVHVCCICDEAAEDGIRSRCKHDFCRDCAKTYVRSARETGDDPDCPRCHIPLSIDLEQPEMEQDEAMVKKSSIINRIKMDEWTSSSKIELLVHQLHRLRSDSASHKSIIFSQFTTMLQLIEWRLRRAGITTVMLDGSMTPSQRQASIDHFMNNVDVECFLVSLRAGGVALNLTEASRVFIVDPWWNPAAEWQSADRVHRIGQTRPCVITRLCIEDSVESRMVALQEKKTSMIHSTVNADNKAMESLSAADLQFLFRGN